MAYWEEPMKESRDYVRAIERRAPLPDDPGCWVDWDDADAGAAALSSIPKADAMHAMYEARDDLMRAIREEVADKVRARRPVWLVAGIVIGIVLTLLGQAAQGL